MSVGGSVGHQLAQNAHTTKKFKNSKMRRLCMIAHACLDKAKIVTEGDKETCFFNGVNVIIIPLTL